MTVDKNTKLHYTYYNNNLTLLITHMDSSMVFGENDLVVKDEQGEMTLTRESDVGCTCAKKLRA